MEYECADDAGRGYQTAGKGSDSAAGAITDAAAGMRGD